MRARGRGFIAVRFVTSAKCTERRGCRCGHPPLQGSAASGTSACCAAVTAGFRTLSSSPADTLSPLHTPQPPPRNHLFLQLALPGTPCEWNRTVPSCVWLVSVSTASSRCVRAAAGVGPSLLSNPGPLVLFLALPQRQSRAPSRRPAGGQPRRVPGLGEGLQCATT